MSKLMTILIVVFVLFLVACEKQGLTPTTPGMDTTRNSAVEKFTGVFINGPHGSVSGLARVFVDDGKYQLVLDDFMTSNGPDLKVYLSKEVQPINFIRLGNLKSVSGTQVYDVPANTDFSEYKYALIHCEQFNHLFGSAELK